MQFVTIVITSKVLQIYHHNIICIEIVYFLPHRFSWILLHVLAFHPLERLRWSLAWISSLPMVGDNWCGRFGLWPSRSVAVSVCGRSGLWPFRFVAVPVYGLSGLWQLLFVAVPVCGLSVCGRFGCGRFGLWPLWHVALPVLCFCGSEIYSHRDLRVFCEWRALHSNIIVNWICKVIFKIMIHIMS